MTNWSSRIVFLVAMFVPLLVGLWLYATVFAVPSHRPVESVVPGSITPAPSRTNQPTEIVLAQAPPTSVQPPATLTAPSVTQVIVLTPTFTVPAATTTSIPMNASAQAAAETQPLDPVGTVRAFYDRVNRGDLDGAAALWTPDMRRRYPPDENIRQRFSQTQSLRVDGANIVSPIAGGSATVSLNLTEVVGASATTRRFSGTWRLRQSEAGWLLDEPNFQSI